MTTHDLQLADLLEYVQAEKRICPNPGRWHQLWELLPDRRQVGAGWVPRLPLILAAWDHTSGLEKLLRLREHIEYAASHGALATVDQFIRALPPEDWHTFGHV
jgi:hypothetical protein